MLRLFLVAALALSLWNNRAAAQVPPEKSISTMKVSPDLKVELFASEPMLINPTAMDIDHKGRVWITEAVNYRRKNFGRPILRPEGDRIVVLTDKTGEGKATEAVTFYQSPELIAPLGICVVPYADGKGQKVFVAQSPNIWVFEDKDGDLKADGPPKVLLTGFGGFDHDHGVHGLSIGPDNKLYFTVGDQGVKDLQSSDGKGRKWTSNNTDCRAGTVWRCDQDGTHLELIAHNFRNNYECCVNSFGEIWLSDNDDDGNQQTRICYVMPGGNYGYHPRGPGESHWHEEQPGIVHKVLRTGFGSPTGITFYEGTLMPERFQGELLHCDAGPREVRRFKRIPRGAGYELEKEVILTSTDNWFRPVDVRVAPDGSIFVCDWYDPGVGGHGMGDWTRGRVYRITPKEHKGYKIPSYNLNADDDLLAGFNNPNLATRNYIRAALVKAKEDQRFSVLFNALRSSENKNTTSARALYAFSTMMYPQYLDRICDTVLYNSHFQPIWTTLIRIVDETRHPVSFDKFLPSAEKKSFESWLNNTDIEQRTELLLVSRNMPAEAISKFFYEQAKSWNGQDRFYLSALNIACGTEPTRRAALLADFEKNFPEWNDKVADLVWELRPKSMLTKLGTLLDDPKLTATQKSRVIDILASSDEAEAGKSLLALLGKTASPEIRDRILDNLKRFLPGKWNSLRQAPELTQAIAKLIGDKSTAVAGLGLIAVSKRNEMLEKVESLIHNKEMPLEVRQKAVLTLGSLWNSNTIEILHHLLMEKELAPKAVEALGVILDEAGRRQTETSVHAIKLLTTALTQPEFAALRSQILGVLAGSRPGVQYLISEQEKKKLPAELVMEAGRLARNTPHQDLRNRAMIAFPVTAGKLDPKKLPAISELIKRNGNAEHGKTLLLASLKNESQCLRCHMVRGIGGNIGPDLSMIGKKAAGKENLYDSILTPSKAIADQYIQWTIVDEGGQSVTGLLVGETETEVAIRDANGKDTKIPLKSIEQRKKSLVSLMPDNLVATMSESDLIDLVEYLTTLKTASLTPESFQIVGPFPNDESDSGLRTAFEPEKGPINLGAKYKGKEGDVTWRTIKSNGGGYFDLKSFHAPKSDLITSYVYQTIESPKDQAAVLLLGHDDGVKLWVNGKEVYNDASHVAAQPEQQKIPVTLKKGKNEILMKIINGDGEHGFYFALTSEEELKLAGKK